MVKTTTNIIELDKRGICLNTLKTSSGFKPVYVLEQSNAIRQMTNGLRLPVLINAKKVVNVSVDSFSNMTNPSNLECASALAIVINSATSKWIMNLWYSVMSKEVPIQVFTVEEEAKNWLVEYV